MKKNGKQRKKKNDDEGYGGCINALTEFFTRPT